MEDSMSDQNKLNQINPLHRTTTIGVRVAREITIYPLSVGEQLKLTDIITKLLRKYFYTAEGSEKPRAEQMGDIELINELVEAIKENIGKIVEIVTDESSESVLDDMTNEQLIDFATIVYEMNFEVAKKKLKNLIQKMKSPSKAGE